MFVGTIKLELLIPGCTSLKEKRKVINSIRDKVKVKYNVSIAEIDYHEKWQRATIGISFVNHKEKNIEILSQKILEMFFDDGNLVILNNKSSIISLKE